MSPPLAMSEVAMKPVTAEVHICVLAWRIMREVKIDIDLPADTATMAD